MSFTSVSDGLPPNTRPVLIVYKSSGGKKVRLIAQYIAAKKRWVFLDKGQPRNSERVTHWAQMPAIPRG